MQTFNKEAVYDAQIAPLIAQILEITQREGIQFVASFGLMDEDPNYNNEPMLCTSYEEGSGLFPTIKDAMLVALDERKAVNAVVYELLKANSIL